MSSHVIQKLLYLEIPNKIYKHYQSICFRKASTHRNNVLLARVDHTDLLVLACGADETAVAVPADTEDDVRVHILKGDYGFPRPHIPDDNHIITACRKPKRKWGNNHV